MDRVSPRSREINDRELLLRDAERRPPTRNETRFKLGIIKDAFRKLQNSNNAMRAVAGNEQLGYRQFARTADDIRKQADRLRATLALPPSDAKVDVDEDRETPSDARSLLTTVADLDRAIQSFVMNKMFHDLKVNDQRLAARASRDLDQIVDISRRVRRAAKRLQKAQGTPHKP